MYILYKNKDYLITVAYYLDYFEVDRLHSKTGNSIISKLKAHLARHGIPDTLVSDNGPPFNGQEFAEFSRAYEFNHVTSSPNCAQSNGKAENAVKVIKRLINKSVADQKDPYLAFLDLRNILDILQYRGFLGGEQKLYYLYQKTCLSHGMLTRSKNNSIIERGKKRTITTKEPKNCQRYKKEI